MTTELKRITWIDNGLLDVNKIIQNLEIVRDTVDEVERLRVKLKDNVDRMYPLSISYAIESHGDHTVLDKTVRAEMKLKQVFVVAGGASDVDMGIEILKNGTDSLLDTPIVLKSSENTGKMKIGALVDYQTISQFDEIVVRSDSSRKIIVTMNFEAVN